MPKRTHLTGQGPPTNALEWEKCFSLEAMMYGCLSPGTNERKFRLFGIACCRRIWHFLQDERAIAAVERSERYVDGAAASPGWLERADWVAAREHCSCTEQVVWAAAKYAAQSDNRYNALRAAQAASWARVMLEDQIEDEELNQCRLLRDIMGNPFAPLLEDPGWVESQSSEVSHLARSIYDQRRFGDVPALADAMERTGCRDATMLEHCRQPGEHARGCWVIDTILRQHEGAVVIFEYLLPAYLRHRRRPTGR